MKKPKLLLIGLCLLALPFSTLSGQSPDSVSQKTVYGPLDLWGIGIKASTDGFGFEAVKGFGERLNIRLGYSTMNIPISQSIPMEGFSATVEANLKFGGANLYVDFYPVKNAIHLTAGIMQNAMRHTLTIIPTSEYLYGDIVVPAADLGIVVGEVTPETKISPYLALGFGNTLSRRHRVSFNFEMGALYHGAPQLSLTGTNMLSPMASENNQQVIMDAVAQYKWYPMVSLQLTFRII